eukprot:TRINITY_DN16594_c0_g1_i1.p1 TRINITY_DN16594_c0_g1~~TRINITY_DN16594_c0_g1_i1.p1  ORF type:complete len:123 (+),score=26.67 TRINITY_DN16594_c0_g1_i1:63-431(+)
MCIRDRLKSVREENSILRELFDKKNREMLMLQKNSRPKDDSKLIAVMDDIKRTLAEENIMSFESSKDSPFDPDQLRDIFSVLFTTLRVLRGKIGSYRNDLEPLNELSKISKPSPSNVKEVFS